MTLHIPDLSQYQGTVDLSKVGPAVILRAHNGYRVDAAFAGRLVASRHYQVVRLFYGFCALDRDPAQQARELAAAVGPLQPGEGFVCDLEQGTGNQTPRLLAYLNELAGRDIEYSGESFAHDHLQGVPRGVLFWEAAYRASEPTGPHFLWQHTDHEHHVGVSSPCDCSIFHGTVQQLRDLISPPAPHPHVDPKPTPHPVQEDDMVIAQGSTPTKYVTNGLTKRGIHNMAEYHDLQQLGYREIKLADATLAAIPNEQP